MKTTHARATGLALALTPALLTALLAAPVAAQPDSGARATVPRADAPIRVTPRAETPGIFDDDAGGNGDADDPAIWVNRAHRGRSLVIATAKNAGLRVYDLAGRLVQSVDAQPAPGPDDEPGRFNNVDIVHGFRLGGRRVDVAVASDRGRDQLRSYAIDPRTGRLRDVTAAVVPLAFAADQKQVDDQETAYGLTTWTDSDDRSYAVVTRRHRTDVALFRLVARGGHVGYRKVDTLRFPSSFALPGGGSWSPCEDPGEGPQLEGLVVDATHHALYAAQEDVGLWRVGIRDGRFTGRKHLVERTQEYGVPAAYDATTEECSATGADPGLGGRIAADVEGLTIYRTAGGGGTLLVSSQGDDTFYTYDRRTNRPLRHFAVVAGRKADGSSDCDGADTVSTRLPGYPHGLLVVQDGDNTPVVTGADGEARVDTDFKLLDAGVLSRR